MPPSKRDIIYSVQDVIHAITNGDSDFEMDADSDSSDEETVVDALDAKKGHLPPTYYDAHDFVDMEPQMTNRTMPGERYHWQKKEFVSPNTDFSGEDILTNVLSPHTPLEYFQKFVSEDMIQELAQNTNEYSFQKNGVSLNTNPKEMEKMIGMYLRMGLMQMSGVRMYWEADTQYTPVCGVMPRNRFQSLLTSLHFVNNLTVSEKEKSDKVWKLRPWLNSFREKCLQVIPEEHNSVDEMMIPFKGKFSSIKQHMRGKPHPWGFKLWVRTGISGMLCDLDVYQGCIDGIRAKSELGFSGDVLMKLASTLPEGQNYKIYADNYFTCIPLVVKLLDRGIHYLGTARQTHLGNCNLEDEKILKKMGRGCFDVKVEKSHNICAVKWYDNRAVTLVSSFVGPEPVQKVQRWDRASKIFIEVDRPYLVDVYNKHMGGVDLLDSFAAKYKFHMKSRRWYTYIFWHTIILAVINAWLLYKRECKALNISKKEIMNRRKFQAQLASSLILVNSALNTPKKGRPSYENRSPKIQSSSNLSAQKRPADDEGPSPGVQAKRSAHPPPDVRKDLIAHFPGKTSRGRCRHCSTGHTTTLCSKCNVRLCFTEEKNCFCDYHCN